MFRKDNGFNSKVINWNNENSISSTVEVKESNLNGPEIFSDEISENRQYINKPIELFDDSHSKAIHSFLSTPTLKRKYKSIKQSII